MRNCWWNIRTYPVCDFVHFVIQEIVVAVKMLIPKHTLSDDFIGELPFQVHHELEHLIVWLPREQDLACVEFKDGCSHGPQVHIMVIAHSNDCKVEKTEVNYSKCIIYEVIYCKCVTFGFVFLSVFLAESSFHQAYC